MSTSYGVRPSAPRPPRGRARRRPARSGRPSCAAPRRRVGAGLDVVGRREQEALDLAVRVVGQAERAGLRDRGLQLARAARRSPRRSAAERLRQRDALGQRHPAARTGPPGRAAASSAAAALICAAQAVEARLDRARAGVLRGGVREGGARSRRRPRPRASRPMAAAVSPRLDLHERPRRCRRPGSRRSARPPPTTSSARAPTRPRRAGRPARARTTQQRDRLGAAAPAARGGGGVEAAGPARSAHRRRRSSRRVRRRARRAPVRTGRARPAAAPPPRPGRRPPGAGVRLCRTPAAPPSR